MYENIQTNNNVNMLKVLNLKELDSKDFISNNTSVKLHIEINNLDQLNQFYGTDIINVPNIHISLEFTKQVFLTLNISDIINKSMLKSIDRNEMRITIKLFTVSDPIDSVKRNNIRIIDRLNYIEEKVSLYNKNHEILYHANQILKSYGKSENEFRLIKKKVSEINNLVSKY